MNRRTRESEKSRKASEKAQEAKQVAVKARDKEQREKDQTLQLCNELVEELTARASAAEEQARKDREQVLQAVKARDKAQREKDQALNLCGQLRGFRKLYQEMATKYPKAEEQRDKALQQVEELTARASAAEEQARKDREQVLQAVKDRKARTAEMEDMRRKLKRITTLHDELLQARKHPWLAVAKALGMSETDTKSISRATKSMHDTLSRDWNESLSKRSQLVIRLPSIVRLLLKWLFRFIRVNQKPVPVEDIVNFVFRGDMQHDDISLREIRKAVQSAVRHNLLNADRV